MVHWVLALTLMVLLLLGLVRIYRVLRNGEVLHMVQRFPPQGMRTVECGACGVQQYIPTTGQVFICYRCSCANQLPSDTRPSETGPILLEATGPLQSFCFKREGDNFFQEMERADIEEAEATAIVVAARAKPVRVQGENDNEDEAPPPSISVNAEASDDPESVVIERQDGAPPPSTSVSADGPDGADESRAVGQRHEDTLPSNTPDAEMLADPEPCVIGRQDSTVTSSSARSGELPQCAVCLDAPGDMVLLPCAHGGVCEGCATRIAQNRATGGAHCPHCRSSIERLVKLHEVHQSTAKGVEVRIPIARAA